MRFILILFFFFSLCIYGQGFEIPVEYFVNNSRNTQDSANYSGSPYLFDDFKPATIYFKNKNFKVNIKLNAYKQSFEIIQNGEIRMLNFSEGMKVSVEDFIFLPLEIESNKIPVSTLFSSNYILYKYFTALYTPEKPAKSSYDKPRLANYKVETRYVLQFPGGTLKDFKLNKKNIVLLFEGDADALDLIKKNKLRFRKESELIEFVSKLD